MKVDQKTLDRIREYVKLKLKQKETFSSFDIAKKFGIKEGQVILILDYIFKENV